MNMDHLVRWFTYEHGDLPCDLPIEMVIYLVKMVIFRSFL